MRKRLGLTMGLAAAGAALLTACAQPINNDADETLACRQQGLNATAISAGACDDVGQFIPGAAALREGGGKLEASAAPAH